MAQPRKVFRIEETSAARLPVGGERCAHESPDAIGAESLQAQILKELGALRAAVAAPGFAAARPQPLSPPAPGTLADKLNLITAKLTGERDGTQADADGAQLTRIANELLAVTSGTEQATQKILAAAEEIDQLANNLSAALKGRIEQGLAQDIQDLVIRVFEACNFQDLIGQRISKVMATLKFIEEHITSVLDELKTMAARPASDTAQYLHGPRLDGDMGHVSQTDIDAIFDT
jgi:chemotaxis regulatin CheY-phosphate phosphatase CheZ